MSKIFVDSTDVSRLNCCSEGHARRILREIKKLLKKQKHQKVTVPEFSSYMGYAPEDVQRRLR